jgi:hypothetical protein
MSYKILVDDMVTGNLQRHHSLEHIQYGHTGMQWESSVRFVGLVFLFMGLLYMGPKFRGRKRFRLLDRIREIARFFYDSLPQPPESIQSYCKICSKYAL